VLYSEKLKITIDRIVLKGTYLLLLYTTYKGFLNVVHMLMLLLFNLFTL